MTVFVTRYGRHHYSVGTSALLIVRLRNGPLLHVTLLAIGVNRRPTRQPPRWCTVDCAAGSASGSERRPRAVWV